MFKYRTIGKYKFSREFNEIILILVAICCVDKTETWFTVQISKYN